MYEVQTTNITVCLTPTTPPPLKKVFSDLKAINMKL